MEIRKQNPDVGMKEQSQKKNYQNELEGLIESLKGERKKVLLHSCCAPCSSYCMEYLRRYFDLTVFYFNPNITCATEYEKRVAEQKRLIEEYNRIENENRIAFLEGNYSPSCFLSYCKGLESCPEGGERCFKCFELRLLETAKCAKVLGMDYFTTTLTISPLKNAAKINEIGREIGSREQIAFLPSDFKKNNGYLRSIELSKQYGLYRQDYCGCAFSKAERDKERE